VVLRQGGDPALGETFRSPSHKLFIFLSSVKIHSGREEERGKKGGREREKV